MGEIRVPVKIQGMNQDGDLSIVGAIEVEALLDTGASMTVVSKDVARAAGIAPMGHRIPETSQRGPVA
jgi:predicted aspartyl protease